MYSPLVSFFPVAYLSCSKTTTVLGRLGGSAMFFKHLIIWKFARVHLQNAGWHSIFTLLRSSANVRHDFFILHVCSLRSVLFRADTGSMHCSDEQKFTRSPKIKNVTDPDRIKQNGCLLNARTKRDWSRGSQFPAVFAACRGCLSLANHNQDRTDAYKVSREGKDTACV